MEKQLGEPLLAEFLFQMSDMYGPAWTPMPVAFHLDFWQGIARLEEEFFACPESAQLASAYIKIRCELLARIGTICQERRQAWLDEIDRQVEEGYYSKHRYRESRT
jgi:hypothetical protein